MQLQTNMKKEINAKIYLLLILSISLVASVASIKLYKTYRTLNNKAELILKDINKELIHQKCLSNSLKQCNSDENIENIARKKLGFVKSDEIIFVTTKNKCANNTNQ
jgi:cell division protein FtsB